MADTISENSNPGSKNFSKVFSRKVNRTRERFLHSLGKADRTQDCEFEENVQLFNNQQNAAQKLQKEIKNYIACLKAMQHASINIYNAIRETYEPNWSGYTEIVNAIEQLSFLWEDYVKRLQTEVQDPLSIYMSRFPDVRARIGKRGRKLVDYDGLRHKLQALEQAKKRDDGKIGKAAEDLQEAEMIYQSLNDEMRYELPQLYDGRINFLASNFASFFNVEGKFQEESSKVKKDMSDVSETLQRANHKGVGILASNSPMKLPIQLRNGGLDDSANAVDLSRDQLSVENSPVLNRNSYTTESPAASGTSTPVPKVRESLHHYTNEPIDPAAHEVPVSTNGRPESGDMATHDYDDQSYETVNVRGERLSGSHMTESRDDDVDTTNTSPHTDVDTTHTSPHTDVDTSPPTDYVQYANEPEYANEAIKDANENSKDESDAIYRVPRSNEPLQDNVPFGSNVLYKVQATHMYNGEDTDELTFDPGDVVCVIPWADPEEQDDGWLHGIKESTGDRGVFPANFTKRL